MVYASSPSARPIALLLASAAFVSGLSVPTVALVALAVVIAAMTLLSRQALPSTSVWALSYFIYWATSLAIVDALPAANDLMKWVWD